MQLFLNATSPFARVARVAALHHGLADQLTLVWSDPWNQDPALLAAHPQLRIPVLVTAEGHAISESLLIAQYLDHIGSGPALVPADHSAAVLARASVAYGLMESAFNVVIARKYEGTAVADASVLGQRRLAALDPRAGTAGKRAARPAGAPDAGCAVHRRGAGLCAFSPAAAAASPALPAAACVAGTSAAAARFARYAV